MPSSRSRWLVWGATIASVCSLALVAAACREIPTTVQPPDAGGSERPNLRIAFVGAYDGATAGPAVRAFEGARLAFDEANGDAALPADLLIISVNTQGDPVVTLEAVAEKIVADPDVVAVIGWPSTPESSVLAEALADAGIAYLDVAPTYADASASDDRSSSALHIVPDDRLQMQALAAAVGDISDIRKGSYTCLAGDGDQRGTGLQEQVATSLSALGEDHVTLPGVEPGASEYPDLARAVDLAGCRVVVWTGGGTDGAAVRMSMDAAGLEGVPLIGADQTRNDAYVTDTGASGDGTVTSCSCALPPDSADVDLQRFIEAYQSTYGGAPGAYSMEGWDAGQIVIDAVRAGATTRASMSAFIADTSGHDGLAGEYRFDGGTLLHARQAVTMAVQRAGRWTSAAAEK